MTKFAPKRRKRSAVFTTPTHTMRPSSCCPTRTREFGFSRRWPRAISGTRKPAASSSSCCGPTTTKMRFSAMRGVWALAQLNDGATLADASKDRRTGRAHGGAVDLSSAGFARCRPISQRFGSAHRSGSGPGDSRHLYRSGPSGTRGVVYADRPRSSASSSVCSTPIIGWELQKRRRRWRHSPPRNRSRRNGASKRCDCSANGNTRRISIRS